MITTLDERVVVARKDHVCGNCLGVIARGTRHPVQKNVDGGDMWTWRSHETCDRIASAIARENGYLSDEWPEPEKVQDAMRSMIAAWTL